MYVSITARTLGDFANTYFSEPGTIYFNFYSFGLKQWNNGKTITENYIPFPVGLQLGLLFTILI